MCAGGVSRGKRSVVRVRSSLRHLFWHPPYSCQSRCPTLALTLVCIRICLTTTDSVRVRARVSVSQADCASDRETGSLSVEDSMRGTTQQSVTAPACFAKALFDGHSTASTVRLSDSRSYRATISALTRLSASRTAHATETTSEGVTVPPTVTRLNRRRRDEMTFSVRV